ncbi:MAG: hypothetical protein HUJ27_12425 [Rhodobacteraceae bacterium]|nr:hypothetical protein [Paracoccaceae bacterium]
MASRYWESADVLLRTSESLISLKRLPLEWIPVLSGNSAKKGPPARREHPMYLRFTTFANDEDSRTSLGIFQAAADIWYDRPELSHLWQVAELRRELDWFNEHLERPDRRWYRPYKRAERSGVCWFKPDATTHIHRARYMAWLLADLGVATTVLRAASFDQVIWQDRHQVVAIDR